jgi:hypothetical protein
MVERIKNGIFFDEKLKPYTKVQLTEELENLLSLEEYDDCIVIREHLKRFEHENNYISTRG